MFFSAPPPPWSPQPMRCVNTCFAAPDISKPFPPLGSHIDGVESRSYKQNYTCCVAWITYRRYCLVALWLKIKHVRSDRRGLVGGRRRQPPPPQASTTAEPKQQVPGEKQAMTLSPLPPPPAACAKQPRRGVRSVPPRGGRQEPPAACGQYFRRGVR